MSIPQRPVEPNMKLSQPKMDLNYPRKHVKTFLRYRRL